MSVIMSTLYLVRLKMELSNKYIRHCFCFV